jgi:acetylornithine/N-succinyldiaminopimelate aminotransferase
LLLKSKGISAKISIKIKVYPRRSKTMRLKDTGLTAQDIKDKVNKYMIETYERFDFLAETAKDQYIYDENGTPYLDFYAGIAVNSAGNCNEKVVNAVCDQVKDIMHTFNYPYTIPQALLAEKVCTTIGMDKIFFQNSGTEANEAMIKMARKYGVEKYGPEKYNIVTAKMGFHGRTFGAMSATGQPDNGCQIGFGPMTTGFTYADYNDLESFKAACNENTIAIMIEPVQGEGGVHPATQEFMQGLRDYCDEKGMLLLLDEVQTGWCRTGAVMSYMNYGVKPDIVSMAKALGGGMPIAAICATEEVSKAFTPGSHGTTFGGHPVSCAAALAEVEELTERHLDKNAKEMGDYFMSLLEKLPHVKEVRGQGLLVGVEFDDSVSGVDVKHECLHRHLLITAIGAHTIRMIPPLMIDKADCEKAYEIIRESVFALTGETDKGFTVEYKNDKQERKIS